MNIIPFQDFIRRYYSGEDFIVFDTETTGLNTFHDDIIEIAARRWNKRGGGELFQELIWAHPNKMNQAAWEIHKIPAEALAKARKPEEVLADFIRFSGNKPLISHNIKFDLPMLNSNLIRHGFKPYSNEQVACTLVYSKEQQLPGKLEELAKHHGVEAKADSLHRALYDVDILIEVLNTLMKKYEPDEMQYSLVL